mgnify:CR=1 FL=1
MISKDDSLRNEKIVLKFINYQEFFNSVHFEVQSNNLHKIYKKIKQMKVNWNHIKPHIICILVN